MLCAHECLRLSRTIKLKLDCLCSHVEYENVIEKWQPGVKRILMLMKELIGSLKCLYTTLDDNDFTLTTNKTVASINETLVPFFESVDSSVLPEDCNSTDTVALRAVQGPGLVGSLYCACFALAKEAVKSVQRHREMQTPALPVEVLHLVLPKDVGSFVNQTLGSISANVEKMLSCSKHLADPEVGVFESVTNAIREASNTLGTCEKLPLAFDWEYKQLEALRAICSTLWLEHEPREMGIADSSDGAWKCASRKLQEELVRLGDSSKDTDALREDLKLRDLKVQEQETKISALDQLNAHLQHKVEVAREQARETQTLKAQLEQLREESEKSQEDLRRQVRKAQTEANLKHVQHLSTQQTEQPSGTTTSVPRYTSEQNSMLCTRTTQMATTLRYTRNELVRQKAIRSASRISFLPKITLAGSSTVVPRKQWGSREHTSMHDVQYSLERALSMQSSVRVLQLANKPKEQEALLQQWKSQQVAVRVALSKLNSYKVELNMLGVHTRRLHVGSVMIPCGDVESKTCQVNVSSDELRLLLQHPYLTSICT